MELKEFYSKDGAEEGAKLPLYSLTGEKTDEYLIVRNFDSASYKKAQTALKESFLRAYGIDDTFEQAEAIGKLERKLNASLIESWSFKDTCDEKAVIKMFENAPQIMDGVIKVAQDRPLFFQLRLSSSTDI